MGRGDFALLSSHILSKTTEKHFVRELKRYNELPILNPRRGIRKAIESNWNMDISIEVFIQKSSICAILDKYLVMRYKNITTFAIWMAIWLSVLLCLAGCSKPGAQYHLTARPDYSLGTLWFDVPADTLVEADAFYIAPTCIWDWEDTDGKTYHHMDVNSPKQLGRVDGSIRLAHALFGQYCCFYAPYYRQVTMESWMVVHEETERRYAVAHENVVRAFNY